MSPLRGWLARLFPAPLWVSLLVLSLTVAGTFTVRRFVATQQQVRFEREAGIYERNLRTRLESYVAALTAARAFWEASREEVTPAEFGRFVRGLDLPALFPGMNSLGYAPLVTAPQRPAFARRLRELSGPGSDAALHPLSSLPLSVPVLYVAPVTASSRRVVGYDMYQEPTRRQAIERALRSGGAAASGPVLLADRQYADRSGLLLYLPVRRSGQVVGLVYVPLRFSNVLPPLPTAGGALSLRVEQGGRRLSGSPPDPSGQGFELQDNLSFAGQTWTLTFSAPPGFGRDAAAATPWAVLLAGLLVSGLAALATLAQVRARRRAEEVSRSLGVSRQRLERARAEFEAVFRAMQDAAVFADPAGVVLFANDALTRSFGVSPAELRGTMLGELHADPRLLERLDRQPGAQTVTTLFRWRDGPDFYGELQRSSVLSERGELIGQLEVIRDVTERLQADRALREGERRYQGVLEGMPQIVWLSDASGEVTYMNRRWQDYVGEDHAGLNISERLHPDDRPEFLRRWQRALEHGQEFETEHRLRSAGGEYRTFVSRSRPIRAASGEVSAWVGSSTDIDAQVHSELSSRLLADVSQSLAHRLPQEAGFQQALELMTVRFADAALLWLPAPLSPEGGTPAALEPPLWAGRGLGSAELGREDAALGPASALKVMGSGEGLVFGPEELEGFPLSAALLLPLSVDGEALGVLGLGFRQPWRDRDLEVGQELAQRLAAALDNRRLLAGLRAAQASLQELNNTLEERVQHRTALLEEANSELEAFSYSVSHDLRTPLRHILGFADLLRKEAGSGTPHSGLSEKGERYLGVMTQAAFRMSTLIDDLLEFSRTSRAEVQRRPVDLAGVVQASIRDFAPDLQRRQVEWQVGPLPGVSADPGLLRQVFDNLLSNALKYTRTRDRAVIEVSARSGPDIPEHEVWISVRDNGVGFDPRYVGKLFGVFQRLHRNDEFEGTGIGLANVRRIVARHGGRVWAESGQPGQPGATFWIALPREAPADAWPPPPGQRSPRSAPTGPDSSAGTARTAGSSALASAPGEQP